MYQPADSFMEVTNIKKISHVTNLFEQAEQVVEILKNKEFKLATENLSNLISVSSDLIRVFLKTR